MASSLQNESKLIARELQLSVTQVQRTLGLLDEGNTIAFVTRYRKDQTQGLDEEQIRSIKHASDRLRGLNDRKTTILKSVKSQGKLTADLAAKIEQADSIKQLEDLYLPYKPKKQTLATLARQRGLEPLAQKVLMEGCPSDELSERAKVGLDADDTLQTIDEVYSGIGHLIAEVFSEDVELRASLRKHLWKHGMMVVSAAIQGGEASLEDLTSKSRSNGSQVGSKNRNRKKNRSEEAYADYFDFRESIQKLPPHRVLAINRGEKAKVLRVRFEFDSSPIFESTCRRLIPRTHPNREMLGDCLRDAIARLVIPGLERETRRELTDKAEAHAVRVFATNLRHLLLQRPVAGSSVLAIDPGYKSGCKIAVLDEVGSLVESQVIYVIGGVERQKAGRAWLVEAIRRNQISVIAIGNGTASRATEEVVASILADELKDMEVAYAIVNEAGASVYSTSAAGREELPELDPTIRSAISIGRRLLDPLSELVKISPEHLGVGMYQHDIKAKHLRASLDEVVESCVNYVGVDANTASPALLKYVSGLNQLSARRFVEYRREHGPFQSREQFRRVAGFGDATFVQSAGFLKINQAANALDATWIHPESYAITEKVLQQLSCTQDDMRALLQSQGKTKGGKPGLAEGRMAEAHAEELGPGESNPTPCRGEALRNRLKNVEVSELAHELETGELLVRDLLAMLLRPGRDPRESLPPPAFRTAATRIEDLEPGMAIEGRVLNVVDFGVFVDIGLSESGLVHISRLAEGYVQDPHQTFSVGEPIQVWVLDVDKQRRRVALTAIDPARERAVKGRGLNRDTVGRRPDSKRLGQGTKSTLRRRDPGNTDVESRTGHPKTNIEPLKAEVAEGKSPMRSFNELMQFYKHNKPER